MRRLWDIWKKVRRRPSCYTCVNFTIPSSYDCLTTALETLSEDKWILDLFKRIFLDKEIKRNSICSCSYNDVAESSVILIDIIPNRDSIPKFLNTDVINENVDVT